MRLFKITMVETEHPFDEKTIYVISENTPSKKAIIKKDRMISYGGFEMSEADYKEFILSGQYTDYNIEHIEELNFLELD